MQFLCFLFSFCGCSLVPHFACCVSLPPPPAASSPRSVFLLKTQKRCCLLTDRLGSRASVGLQEHPDCATNTPAIGDLQILYRAAKARFDCDEEFKTKAREAVVALQSPLSVFLSLSLPLSRSVPGCFSLCMRLSDLFFCLLSFPLYRGLSLLFSAFCFFVSLRLSLPSPWLLVRVF